MNEAHRQPGPIALVGSGEYLDVMLDTDRWLLDQIGGPAHARVVVLPTASGLEDLASPTRWMRMGVEHFTRLGAHVDALPILDHQSAHDPRWVDLLQQADFIYYSGGNPQHLIASMAGTPAWDAVQRRHRQGAALAGCSAGAMAICGLTVSRLRGLREGSAPEWLPALGILPRLIVVPHFDRMASYVGKEALDQVLAFVPAEITLAGIDEDTALVRLLPEPDVDGRSTWQVMGRQTVSLFTQRGSEVYGAGDTVLLTTG